MMNCKKIFTKKKVTGVAALLVALVIIITGTFAWKDFSQFSLNLLSGDYTTNHWVSLVDDFKSADVIDGKKLTDWKRDEVAEKEVYVTSDILDEKANPEGTGYDANVAAIDYAPVYVRVQLIQTLIVGGEAVPQASPTNISSNQYPTQIEWNQTGTIKTIDEWVTAGSLSGEYWVQDSDGWLYWAQPLEFGQETTHLLDTVKLLVAPVGGLDYTVNVKLEAVSSDLDSTTGAGIYKGGFAEWNIASNAQIMPLFIEAFVFTIDTTLGVANNTYSLQVNDNVDNDFAVDWGDGTALDVRTNDNRNTAHNYTTDGEYTVKIIGTMPSAMKFLNDKKLIAVQSGFLQNTASTMADYFRGCTNLKTIASNLFAKSTTNTDLYRTFYNCTSLTSIPSELFENNTELTSLSYTFYGCARLTSIPSDLFKNNTEVTSFESTFASCSGLTGSIPANLFETNTAVTTFENIFDSCTSLTGLIPADLFKNNTEVTTFRFAFYGCSGLLGLSADLFRYNTKVTTFESTFVDCIGLTGTIPTDLFRYNTAATNFNYTFSDCSGLISIPADLFKYNIAVTTFNGTFQLCTGITSALPTLWVSHPSAAHSNTFTLCTKATNIAAARTAGWAQ